MKHRGSGLQALLMLPSHSEKHDLCMCLGREFSILSQQVAELAKFLASQMYQDANSLKESQCRRITQNLRILTLKIKPRLQREQEATLPSALEGKTQAPLRQLHL